MADRGCLGDRLAIPADRLAIDCRCRSIPVAQTCDLPIQPVRSPCRRGNGRGLALSSLARWTCSRDFKPVVE